MSGHLPASGCKWLQVAASGCKWLPSWRLAPNILERQLAATCGRLHILSWAATCGHLRHLAAARVAASGCFFQIQKFSCFARSHLDTRPRTPRCQSLDSSKCPGTARCQTAFGGTWRPPSCRGCCRWNAGSQWWPSAVVDANVVFDLKMMELKLFNVCH